MVYLIHFDKKLAHAQHYIGFSNRTDIEGRIKEHMGKGKKGAKLMAAVNKADIKWSVVRIWPQGDRNFERSLKKRKCSSQLCPVCNPKSALINGLQKPIVDSLTTSF